MFAGSAMNNLTSNPETPEPSKLIPSESHKSTIPPSEAAIDPKLEAYLRAQRAAMGFT